VLHEQKAAEAKAKFVKKELARQANVKAIKMDDGAAVPVGGKEVEGKKKPPMSKQAQNERRKLSYQRRSIFGRKFEGPVNRLGEEKALKVLNQAYLDEQKLVARVVASPASAVDGSHPHPVKFDDEVKLLFVAQTKAAKDFAENTKQLTEVLVKLNQVQRHKRRRSRSSHHSRRSRSPTPSRSRSRSRSPRPESRSTSRSKHAETIVSPAQDANGDVSKSEVESESDRPDRSIKRAKHHDASASHSTASSSSSAEPIAAAS
jgi:hypothetical protein